MNRPLIIAITPVRNEAWVIDAYLASTSTWADIIIVADQHSTDGTRDIIKRYQNNSSSCRVILVDNPSLEMDQAAARRLLFEEVDKIEGDKIVFAIDADEFLTPNFANTATWEKIISSPTNSIFCFKWINLYGDFEHVLPLEDNKHMEWACHFDSSMKLADEYFNCEQRAVHEMRIPCLPEDRATYILVDDIQFIHLARLNLTRTKNKEDFYQVSSVAKLHKNISAVTLYRSYHRNNKIAKLDKEVPLLDRSCQIDLKSKVRFNDIGQYYIDEIISIIKRMGPTPFYKIDIWDTPYMLQSGIEWEIPLKYRILHRYLRVTRNISNIVLIRIIDKIIKRYY